MADIHLTQSEADALIQMEKFRTDAKQWDWPHPGERLAIALTSQDKRESFILDITRARIKITKATYQERARQAIVLMRLDLDGPPHTNPDGQELPCPHLHIYREGFGTKWAFPLPAGYPNPDVEDLLTMCQAFMADCAIVDPPDFQKGLFS